eukprot:scaffold29_cov17-Tisochrysis_lutea.AAC.1
MNDKYSSIQKRCLSLQQASRLACNLHAHSVMYTHKLASTRHAQNVPHSQVLEPDACFHDPADLH